ncbi:MAG: hypothetical protein PHD76_07515 [Methylacidiphilales bacterium]|nr:hypothetical protein [Candidatus Methylacidiphilales bacterium]
MKRLPLLFLFFCPLAHAEDTSSAFEQFRQVAQPAAEKLGEKIVFQYDPGKHILKIGRELKINELRKMTQIQTVKIDYLEDAGALDGVPSMPEPWIKIRCLNNEKHVQVDSSQTVDGAEIEDLAKSETLRFLIIPCRQKDLKAVLEAYATFRESFKNKGT